MHTKFEERVAGGGESELWGVSRSILQTYLSDDKAVAKMGHPVLCFDKYRLYAVQVDCEAGAGGVGFDFGEDAGSEVDGFGVLGEGAGHGDEDAVDLGLLFVEEADELIVLLDGFEGFDEDSLAG